MTFASPKLPCPSFVQSCSSLSAPVAVFRDRHRDPSFGIFIENDCGAPLWSGGRDGTVPDGLPAATAAVGDDLAAEEEAVFLRSAVACQVSLLPRHWNWLSEQSDGASVTLRHLVDEARQRAADVHDEVRGAREAAYRALRTLAGDAPGFDDACCALFAGDREAFARHTAHWPRDVVAYGLRLAAPGWLPEHLPGMP
ncbi:DUF2239 family protein [Xylophilus ampelinus]|uniref:Uncharacterized protein DUF2239 n=1 Tax=Xylophilus ampelinus TaxID=54067 RepID=A0A318T079_9BURK|nr:DUF2239 family protein [Xylophilus ampelinus]MCS4509631.1 DUF2239 family protein [Xylophilus ampelinus]PYE78884.1 uncharacterized protein DUF2239 [Xylophilus ampelinus]